ncbi:hypothetical protein DICVIV_07881 [Dictyocaulus viviparus]|uniref:Uncharacterized protein n=1 Tax=Dictyocaulus viviparus TaxID=29172 RepID=A0A0D8XUK9_DICVI|nr:hypothetical protein DICVIV_07881 [Dictyocaulus viviparus]
MISSTPLIIQLKINLTLTISIAIERILALSYPIVFRKLCNYSYTKYCLLFGCLLAIFDILLEFVLTPFERVPNCAAIGCFVSDQFRYYMGISNMMMGIIVIVLTTLILIKLRVVKQQPTNRGVWTNMKRRNLKQANRTCAAILFISLVFVTIPSVGVGFVEMIGYSIFRSIGPFYIVGLLCAGACNSFISIALNKNTWRIARDLISGHNTVSKVITPTI